MALRILGPVLLVLFPMVAIADDPPVVSVRLIRPDLQGSAVIDLFRGSRASHPAAALAAWRHANGNHGLSKPLEALISLFNPPMVRELKAFDSAEFVLRFAPETGAARWSALIPRDDGSLGALVTAIALTDGASDSTINGQPVMRLGPPGAPLAANLPGHMIVASDIEGLRSRSASKETSAPAPEGISGCRFRIDPSGLRNLKTLNGRRLNEALIALKCEKARGEFGLVNESLDLRLTTTLNAPVSDSPSIDPDWLAVIPKKRLIAVAAIALDHRASALESTFALLDRVEKADPARAAVAPIRTRLNLLAAGVKVFPDQDLWPNLKGLTVVVLSDGRGDISGGLVVLHAKDVASAKMLLDRVLPRLAGAFVKANDLEPVIDGVRPLGQINDRPLRAKLTGKSVVVGWGDAFEAGMEVLKNPENSAAELLRGSMGSSPLQRFGAFWPGRWREVVDIDSALGKSMADAPPMIWTGRRDGNTLHDQVRWDKLSGVIKRWLDALPLETPPDH